MFKVGHAIKSKGTRFDVGRVLAGPCCRLNLTSALVQCATTPAPFRRICGRAGVTICEVA